MSSTGRREFLRHAALAAGVASLPMSGAAAEPPRAEVTGTPSGAAAAPAPGWLFLGPDEAAFVEALVDAMCPADALTPRGVECGLAIFIDRQLAGGFGRGERLYLRGPLRPGRPEDGYQLPLTPERFFKIGLLAADSACRRLHGTSFAELSATDADTFLSGLAEGKVEDARLSLAEWFNELVYPLFVQACFADPIYGGNRDKVFWKMLGYPGLPAVNGLNMIKYRGQPYPGAATPKSMEDFG
ncbi:MAG: gluconate 2-dehydrogenase subunit 3 family protein [Opitutaceae bacterium]